MKYLLLLILPAIIQSLPAKQPEVTLRVQSLTYAYGDNPLNWWSPSKGAHFTFLCIPPQGKGIMPREDGRFVWEGKKRLSIVNGEGDSIERFRVSWSDRESFNTGPRVIELDAERLPKTGAEPLRLKGTIPAYLLSRQIRTKPKPLELTNDQTVTIGPYTFTVRERKQNNFSLHYTVDKSAIPFALVFTDEDGNEIKIRERGRSTTSTSAKMELTMHYMTETVVNRIHLSLKTWRQKEAVTIQVDLPLAP